MLGLATVSDALQVVQIAALVAVVAAYNAALTVGTVDQNRFMRFGRKLDLASWALDTAVITVIAAAPGEPDSPVYLLYWFVLVAAGFTNHNIRRLALIGVTVLAANAAAAFLDSHSAEAGNLAQVIVLRSGVLFFGVLVAAYVAKSRSQDELASERGSYLHAILNCGARLTGFRSVHELALHVLESAVTETGAAGGELLLISDETHELECEAFYATGEGSGESAAPPEAQLRSFANWVTNSGREFVMQTGGRIAEDGAPGAGDRPAIAVPLLGQASGVDGSSSVLGVLIVWGHQGEDFGEDALDILRIFAAIAGAATINLRLYTNLQKSFLSTLQSLANGLEARDEYTRGHSERVMQVACMIAEELGVPSESIESLRNAALLHDIGKIGVPDAVLRKAGKLTADEWETMRRHPLVSEEICRPLGLAPEILFLVKHHHERLDAKGYPGNLPAHEQPLLQRVLVVADSFDAMRSRRPYRDTMPQEELVGELNRGAGRTLDPTVVDALRRLMDRGELDAVYEEHDRVTDCIAKASRSSARKAA